MKIVIRIIQSVLALVWAALLAVNIKFFADEAAGRELPGLGSFACLVVEDGAMEPELSPGDLAVFRMGGEAEPGEMVLHRGPAGLAVARIIGTSEGQLILKQDSAGEGGLAQPEEVEGVFAAYIPGFGAGFGFMHSLPGILCIGVVGLGLIVLPAFMLRAPSQREGRNRRAGRSGYQARH